MTYDAKYFGDLFVQTAKSASGPFGNDTVTADVRLLRASGRNCTVEIAVYPSDSADADEATAVIAEYAEKFAKTEYVGVLRQKFGSVKIL
ncbi:MAG: hypothetical protein NC132_05525 [Corallococcus sp.]|nr:hypothetical protein [Corallococcus sp.]MCM1359996.1 hypothetical protein [Corallococcus sp.]MCM1395553.1 hypothetical protein [Corallococcus sp.]